MQAPLAGGRNHPFLASLLVHFPLPRSAFSAVRGVFKVDEIVHITQVIAAVVQRLKLAATPSFRPIAIYRASWDRSCAEGFTWRA